MGLLGVRGGKGWGTEGEGGRGYCGERGGARALKEERRLKGREGGGREREGREREGGGKRH